jgi:transcriptional regulator
MPREASDLLHGTLDVLVLKTLSWGAMHGYAIVEWIEQRGGGDLVIVDAALYKALHRLEDAGAIESEWGVSENNRKAKFYELTVAGRKRLAQETSDWQRLADAMAAALAARPEEI